MSTEYAVHFKKIIANMSETSTMKEVDEICKNAKKEIKVKIVEEKKEKKAQAKKRGKKVKVDDEGNEIEKVKKPLNNYQQFIRDNRQKVKDQNPEAKGNEIFTMIAALWAKHKEDMKNNEDSEDDKKVAVIDSDDDSDIKRVDEDSDDKKKKGKKENKKVKKSSD